MKKDLDRLMRTMKVDAIYAEGHASRDTNMYYLLNGANIFAHYIKRRGKPAYVLHAPIEREVARNTGCRLINLNKYDRQKFLKKYRDIHKANARFVSMLLDESKVKGNVIFYGNFPLGAAYQYVKHILRFSKNLNLYDGEEKGLITRARMTKDNDEIVRIRKVRDAVVHAFDVMLRAARACRVRGDFLITGDKRKLLIGDLKKVIRSELFSRNIFDSGGMIVAQGRDAGVPHNSGRDRQPVRLGEPIVFDIFPQEVGGGYFFDFTRTICFGFASRPIKTLYHTVSCAHDYACSLLRVGRRTREIELKICEYFEAKGHKTFLSDPKTQIGYCHSLGHGLGLNVHESPFFNLYETNKDRVEPNMVFTIEPGLYYPEKGYGVRIEDVMYVTGKGKIVNLTKYPRKLVIPV
jgi:Xaa-Pro aminopeptidase